MELGGFSSASISVDLELRRGLTQNLRSDSTRRTDAEGLGAALSRVQILDLRISVTIEEVRTVLVAQAEHGAHRDADAAGPTPDAIEARMPEFWRPEAVADRILGFVGSAAGGDVARLQRLMRAVEKAFTEVKAILGGVLPGVSRRTMHLVRQGLAGMLQELEVAQAGPARGEAVELSATARDLAAQTD